MNTPKFLEKYPDFKLSQTAMKDLEKEETCPAAFQSRWLEKLEDSKSSWPMTLGHYFETHCIGGGAHGQKVEELPKQKNGSPYIDEKRVNAQIEAFRAMFQTDSPYFCGYYIQEVQEFLETRLCRGVIDFMIQDKKANDFISDLKLTKDLDNDFGDFQWKDQERIDFTQQVFYSLLYEKVHGVSLPLKVFVFEYGPKLRKKVFNVDINPSTRRDVVARIGAALDTIDYWYEKGFPCRADPETCDSQLCDKEAIRAKELSFEIFDVDY